MKLVLENYGFLVYMYYIMHPGYQTPIFGKKKCAYSNFYGNCGRQNPGS